MKAVEKKLDIDRWMYKVICDCGVWFWACERRPAVCGNCKKQESIEKIKKEFDEISL